MADVRYAVRIEDRRRDEVGVALGSHRRLSGDSWLRARRGRLCTFSYRRCLHGSVRFLRRYRAGLRSFSSQVSSLLSSQPSRVTSARLSLQPSSRPCRPSSPCALSSSHLSWRHAFSPRPFCWRGRAALYGLLRLALFRSFLSSLRHHEFLFNSTISGIIVGRSVTASLPRASQTPRKPAVFAPDYRIRCRARRGRSFPIPQPAVQGGADSRWRRRCAAFRRSSDRCRR